MLPESRLAQVIRLIYMGASPKNGFLLLSRKVGQFELGTGCFISCGHCDHFYAICKAFEPKYENWPRF